MKKMASVLVLPALLAVALPSPATAGSSTDAALGLGAFAVFNQIIRGETVFHGLGHREVVRERVIVQQPPPVVYAPPAPVYYTPAPPPVEYRHGAWVSQHGGWVWVPRHRYAKHGWKSHKHHGHHDRGWDRD